MLDTEEQQNAFWGCGKLNKDNQNKEDGVVSHPVLLCLSSLGQSFMVFTSYI